MFELYAVRYAPLKKTHGRRARNTARWYGQLRGIESGQDVKIYFWGEHHMMLKQAGYTPEEVTDDRPAYVQMNQERTEIRTAFSGREFIDEQQAKATGRRSAYGVDIKDKRASA